MLRRADRSDVWLPIKRQFSKYATLKAYFRLLAQGYVCDFSLYDCCSLREIDGRWQLGITMKIDKSRIEQFIREKVEIETLTDAQIARLLNVGTSTVSHWRNKFNIKPADKFKRKFKEKYGQDALECFDMMIRNRATLQEIASYFGFSREYARQVYNKLYHGSYSEHQRQRRYR